MYEDLIKRLQDFAAGTRLDEDAQLAFDAADAIEMLDMKLHGANAAIAGMQREIERMVIDSANSKPKWIPVTERLPEKPKNYPNCKLREYYFLVTLETNAVVYREYDFDNKRWHGTNGIIRVTHWMPLPEPPKDGE